MKVLITGAAGQLGLEISRVFAQDGEVVACSHDRLDICDHAAVLQVTCETRPDVILNCAAYNDVDGAETDPVAAMQVNAFGVRSLAAAARETGAVLVHYGTDFVFDGTADEPYTEEIPPNPQSVYATSKLLGEWFASDTDHYVLRVESLFGGSAANDADGLPRGSSVDRMADAILSDREVRAFDDRTVSPSFVEDVADATLALLRTRAPFGLYHCVGSGMGTWVDVVQELARYLNRPARIVPVQMADFDMKANRPKFCALSNAKLARVGVSMPTWQDALARFATGRLVAL